MWSTTPVYPGEGHEGPVNTEVAELFWQGDYLIAATHGRGMYRAHPLAVVYVSATAPPGGDGTLAKPFQTFQAALTAAGPGATIHFLGGTYDEPSLILTQRQILTTSGNGAVVY